MGVPGSVKLITVGHGDGQTAGGQGQQVGPAAADIEIHHGRAGPGAQGQGRAGIGERQRADRAIDEIDGALVGGDGAAGHRDRAGDAAGAAERWRRRPR